MVSVTPCHNYPDCYGKIVKAISLDSAQTEPMTCLIYDYTLQKYSETSGFGAYLDREQQNVFNLSNSYKNTMFPNI